MCLLERNARTLWSTNLSICQSVNLLVCLRCRLQPQIVCCPKLQNIFNFLRAFCSHSFFEFEMSQLPATAEYRPLSRTRPPHTLQPWQMDGKYFLIFFWLHALLATSQRFVAVVILLASASASVLLFFSFFIA